MTREDSQGLLRRSSRKVKMECDVDVDSVHKITSAGRRGRQSVTRPDRHSGSAACRIESDALVYFLYLVT